MKLYLLAALFAVALMAVHVHADCDEQAKSDDTGDTLKTYFKNLSCKVKKGTDTVIENTKPLTDRISSTAKDIGSSISSTAKDLGSSISQKYDEVKHKLTDDEVPAESSSVKPVVLSTTEKVPLAPLGGAGGVAPATSGQR